MTRVELALAARREPQNQGPHLNPGNENDENETKIGMFTIFILMVQNKSFKEISAFILKS